MSIITIPVNSPRFVFCLCLTEPLFFLGYLYVLAYKKYFSGGCSLSYGGWLLVSQIASNKPSDSEGFLLSFLCFLNLSLLSSSWFLHNLRGCERSIFAPQFEGFYFYLFLLWTHISINMIRLSPMHKMHYFRGESLASSVISDSATYSSSSKTKMVTLSMHLQGNCKTISMRPSIKREISGFQLCHPMRASVKVSSGYKNIQRHILAWRWHLTELTNDFASPTSDQFSGILEKYEKTKSQKRVSLISDFLEERYITFVKGGANYSPMRFPPSSCFVVFAPSSWSFWIRPVIPPWPLIFETACSWTLRVFSRFFLISSISSINPTNLS